MNDTCGRTSSTPFGHYDPASCSLRTSEATFPWGSTESSLTFPPSGIACGGRVYELPTLVPRTAASGCSSLLSTPDTALLKTPTSNLGTNGGSQHPDKRKAGGHGPTLADEVEHLLPTPTSRDHKGRNQRDDESCLPGAVGKLLPTPTTQPTTGNGHARNLGGEAKLLRTPRALTGADTPPLSKGGDGSSDGQLQLLWTNEDD
ncbi:MAG: hypothetical protein WD794_02560 [Mycobacteriales bacterium]